MARPRTTRERPSGLEHDWVYMPSRALTRQTLETVTRLAKFDAGKYARSLEHDCAMPPAHHVSQQSIHNRRFCPSQGPLVSGTRSTPGDRLKPPLGRVPGAWKTTGFNA